MNSKYQDTIELMEFAEKSEKSLRDFTNWILAISLGCFTLLIFQLKDVETESMALKIIYKIIVGYSMIAIFISGMTKYHLLNRENKLSINYSALLKLKNLDKSELDDKYYNERSELLNDWFDEFHKISLMSHFLNASIIVTGIQVIILGIFILILV